MGLDEPKLLGVDGITVVAVDDGLDMIELEVVRIERHGALVLSMAADAAVMADWTGITLPDHVSYCGQGQGPPHRRIRLIGVINPQGASTTKRPPKVSGAVFVGFVRWGRSLTYVGIPALGA
jgi:hypothetical protein